MDAASSCTVLPLELKRQGSTTLPYLPISGDRLDSQNDWATF